MTIAIIGAGQVGSALGRNLVARGEQVHFGVPDPDKYASLAGQLGGAARVGTVPVAVAAATEIVVLAIPYAAAAEAVRGIGDWGGRILVDATNPIAPGLSGLSVGTGSSGAEELARLATHARVVKAFNTTGFENMADPQYLQGRIFMPVCGDDAAARSKIVALAISLGFDGVDAGALAAARYLEPFAMTWIHLAYRQGFGRNFAFSIIRR
jgi:8-hydroxy-5-deazaflavin:NADPH oxidoreductase